ncbi:GntR family transcriptional regulator [Williamsia soli]|uniref:GntR family transcriptional regulator n=1 Tax=Williamsia soli TaxID=364929 RepID=UPI001A9DF4D3|nr:GntR family transcriptional regulator [Williamsia soli]
MPPKRSTYVLDTLGSRPTAVQHARTVIEDTLAEAILSGDLASGTPLRQAELAEVFGVSRMPVREALLALTARGLVDNVPHKGAVVISVDAADVVNTYRIRAMLEPEALGGSIPLLDPDDLDHARECLLAMDGEPPLADLGRLNSEFHLSLYRRHPNAKLLKLIAAELDDEERYLRFHLAELGTGQLAQDEHRQILEHAVAREVQQAVTVLRQHISAAADTIEMYFRQRSPN